MIIQEGDRVQLRQLFGDVKGKKIIKIIIQDCSKLCRNFDDDGMGASIEQVK